MAAVVSPPAGIAFLTASRVAKASSAAVSSSKTFEDLGDGGDFPVDISKMSHYNYSACRQI